LESFGQLRQLEISGEPLALAPAGDTDDVADLLLQHDPEILPQKQIPRTLVRDEGGRSDCRMAGERQLALRREYPHARAVDRVPWLKNEYGLGQVELGRDGLHSSIAEPFGVEDYGEGIACQRRLGEHIERLKPARHQQQSGGLRTPRRERARLVSTSPAKARSSQARRL
jgi:hypothetical protein